VTLHTLSELQWKLFIRAKDKPVTVRLIRIRERMPQSGEARGEPVNGWYDWIGNYWGEPPNSVKPLPKSDSFLGSVCPRLDRPEERFASFQIANRLKEIFPDVDGFYASANELTAQGHEVDFKRQFVNVGQAFAGDVTAFACHQFPLAGKPVMTEGDMFMPRHNAKVYSRANHPRNGGLLNSLAYIPKDAPIDWQLWGDLAQIEDMRANVAAFAGRMISGWIDITRETPPDYWLQFPEVDGLTLYGEDASRFTEARIRSYFEAYP
jgi:hypothetical protein